MTLEECYARMGADYEDVLRRLGKEERIKRFLLRILEDESYINLFNALKAGNAGEAFRAAHSLKGICMNLGLTRLCVSVSALTEELRGGIITPAMEPMANQVETDYQQLLHAISELERI